MATILQSFETGIRVLEVARPNLGCPLNNLAQEMSPIDSGFQKRTERVFKLWTDTFATAIRRAIRRSEKHLALPGGPDRGNPEPGEKLAGSARAAQRIQQHVALYRTSSDTG